MSKSVKLNRTERIHSIKEELARNSAEIFVSMLPHEIYYFTGAYVDGVYVFSEKDEFLFTSPLYAEDAERMSQVRVIASQKDYLRELKQVLRDMAGLKTLISLSTPTEFFLFLKRNHLKIKAIDTQTLRIIKDRNEISLIQKSYQIIERALSEGLNEIKEGITELELKAEIEYRIRKYGAENESFDSIVVFGEKSSVPHAVSGTRKLKYGDLILIDVGARYQGYCSDITRCYMFGKADSEIEEVYKRLKKAQEIAFNSLREGVKVSQIERKARQYLKKYGLSEYFCHSLGHGIGLEVHEKPVISIKSKDVLKYGMIFTIEPGLYFKGKFGLRLENGVAILETPVKLTSLSENLLVVGG